MKIKRVVHKIYEGGYELEEVEATLLVSSDNYPDVYIFHDKQVNKWFTIDIPTGMSISSGKTKKVCINNYIDREERYHNVIGTDSYKKLCQRKDSLEHAKH